MSKPDDLMQCIAEVLNCDASSISNEDGLNLTKGWDSVAHTALIVAIEERFEIGFDFEEFETLVNVKSIRASLAEKGITP